MNGRPATETTTEFDTPTEPPFATVPARAQSYSDLSHAVSPPFSSASVSSRKRSIEHHEALADALSSILEYDDWQYTQEEELLDASHEDYEYGNIMARDRHIDQGLMHSDSINHNSSNHKRTWTPYSKVPIPR